jgi:hypothetical protein
MSKKLWNTFISKAIKKSISEANITKHFRKSISEANIAKVYFINQRFQTPL